MGQAVKCILVKEGWVLLVKQTKDNDDMWIFPGGKLNENENPEDCTRREMKEELNLEIKTLEKIGEMQNTWKGKEDLLHCFVCQVADDNIIMNKSEIKEAKWFPSEKLPILGPTSTKILKMWKEKI